VFAIQADGWLETHVVTAHVAGGSLLLATAVATALAAVRTLDGVSVSLPGVTAGKMGATT
jgi:hypothetical protein